MKKQEKGLSRRQMLGIAIGLSGFALSGQSGSVFAQEEKRLFTPPLTLGPFYPQIKPLDQDDDLTVLRGKHGHAQGKIIHLTGRVMNLKGEPVSGARVQIWQADANGRYTHNSDPNPGQRDPYFQGYSVQKTNEKGQYYFKTIKPGAYPGLIAGMRTPHIHFEVDGKIDRVVTQVFFPNEPLNEQDSILQSIKGPHKEALIVKMMPPSKEMEADSVHAVWDVVLLKG
ncbi:MAG TPA: protocatechuate 3,4-dioxygenase [Pyrinomonadaceae bacterium]|jgi:protocatechuate 3,4-dioxygenase beta subunit